MAASRENSICSGHQGASPAPVSVAVINANVEPTCHQLSFTDSFANGTVALIRFRSMSAEVTTNRHYIPLFTPGARLCVKILTLGALHKAAPGPAGLVIRCAIVDPLLDHVHRCLIEERTALWHAHAYGGRPIEFLNQVAIGNIARCDAVQSIHLQAGDVH